MLDTRFVSILLITGKVFLAMEMGRNSFYLIVDGQSMMARLG